MLNSMTGYGEVAGEFDGVSYAIEIKAVNNRYLKTIIKLPETCTFLEDDIDKELRHGLSRGTINCVLRFKSVSANARYRFDDRGTNSLKGGLRFRRQTAEEVGGDRRWQYAGPDGILGVNPATGRPW